MPDYVMTPQYRVTVPPCDYVTPGLMSGVDKKKLDSITWPVPVVTAAVNGLMAAGDKQKLDSLRPPPLPGKLPTGSQGADGFPPDFDHVLLAGACKSVTLPTLASGRHSQVFFNATDHTVIFTAAEKIVGLDKFELSSGMAVNFVRDPGTNQWRVWQ